MEFSHAAAQRRNENRRDVAPLRETPSSKSDRRNLLGLVLSFGVLLLFLFFWAT
jgi:hypothetical protein